MQKTEIVKVETPADPDHFLSGSVSLWKYYIIWLFNKAMC